MSSSFIHLIIKYNEIELYFNKMLGQYMWETWTPSLGWEDPLEKGTAIHCSILAWRIP